MSGVDWAIVVILGLSILLGVLRGVVREVFALCGWIVGVLLALRFAEPLAQSLPLDLPSAARTGIVGLLIIVATLIAAALAAAALRALLAAAKLSLEDRVLGGIFGILRGALIVALAALVAIAAGATRQPWWEASAFLPWVQASVRFASPLLPQSIARHASNPS
jgi:membrane protein required for colicin V production